MLGERPAYRELVSPYIGLLWDEWPGAASMVRSSWRAAFRAKTNRRRGHDSRRNPVHVPDMLIRDRGLQPTTEARLTAVAHDAVDALVRAAVSADRPTYQKRKREFDATLSAIEHLRLLRHPPTYQGGVIVLP